MADGTGQLLAISDLHVAYEENRTITRGCAPSRPTTGSSSPATSVRMSSDIEWALGLLRERFGNVIWAPGNHELWTPKDDPVQLRGVERYEYLVEMCRRLDIVTPEDDYPIFHGEGGPAVIAPLFLLYDYTFRPRARTTRKRRWPRRTRPASSAPTSTSCTPTPIPAARPGARPGSS